ncbi:MAG: DUF4241 domain-containing protein [Propionibacterium sp.]|nr:DUF4241 domain-containing protein [Propionibacterium sp.]
MHPLQRVRAFLVDYEAAHAAIATRYGGDDADVGAQFDEWRTLLGEVAERHGAPGFYLPGNAFMFTPEHGSATRVLDEQRPADGHAVVAARREAFPPFVEYRLVEHDGGWRIVGIDEFPEAPDSPALDGRVAEELLAKPSLDAELSPLDGGDRPDPASLFAEHDFTDDDGDDVHVRLRDVGTFDHDGVLALGDFGYDLDLVRPLVLRVEPGTASVDVVTAYERCAAVRATFTDAEVESWAKAESDEGPYFGVDAGNLALVDAASAYAMTVRQKERAWEQFADDPTRAMLVDRDGAPVGVIAGSGWGDGTYPAYWGLDASGAPAQLIIDFGVLPGAPWAEPSGDAEDVVDGWDDDAPTELTALDDTSSPSAELRGTDDEDRERLPLMFRAGRVVHANGFEEEVTLAEAGSFPTDGTLVVADFVGDVALAVTVARTMPVGQVGVEWIWTEEWGERPAALRLRFSDAEPAHWRMALEHDDFFTTTDGLLAILDLDRARGLTLGAVVRERDAWQEDDDTVRIVHSPDGDPIGVLALAGLGAGDYPVYVGLDAAGSPAQLVVDFGLLGDYDDEDEL